MYKFLIGLISLLMLTVVLWRGVFGPARCSDPQLAKYNFNLMIHQNPAISVASSPYYYELYQPLRQADDNVIITDIQNEDSVPYPIWADYDKDSYIDNAVMSVFLNKKLDFFKFDFGAFTACYYYDPEESPDWSPVNANEFEVKVNGKSYSPPELEDGLIVRYDGTDQETFLVELAVAGQFLTRREVKITWIDENIFAEFKKRKLIESWR